MLGLAIETSLSTGSICVFDGPAILSNIQWARQKSHSELITQALATALDLAGLQSSNIKGVVCGVGPGSFTGIRVGINTARAIAYSNQIPALAVDSLHTLQLQVPDTCENTLAWIYGFRDIVYTRLSTTHEHNQILAQPIKQALELADKADVIIGNAHEFLKMPPSLSQKIISDPQLIYPRAETLAKNFYNHFQYAQHWSKLKPIYVRDSEPEEKLKEK